MITTSRRSIDDHDFFTKSDRGFLMSWNALVGQVSDVVLEESTKSKWCHDPATNRTGEEVSPSREGRFVEVWDHISTTTPPHGEDGVLGVPDNHKAGSIDGPGI
jgi:hypothetical protein